MVSFLYFNLRFKIYNLACCWPHLLIIDHILAFFLHKVQSSALQRTFKTHTTRLFPSRRPIQYAMAGILGGIIAPIMGPVVSGLLGSIAGQPPAPAPAPAPAQAPAAAPAPAPTPTVQAPAPDPAPAPAPQSDQSDQGQGQGGINLGGQNLVNNHPYPS